MHDLSAADLSAHPAGPIPHDRGDRRSSAWPIRLLGDAERYRGQPPSLSAGKGRCGLRDGRAARQPGRVGQFRCGRAIAAGRASPIRAIHRAPAGQLRGASRGDARHPAAGLALARSARAAACGRQLEESIAGGGRSCRARMSPIEGRPRRPRDTILSLVRKLDEFLHDNAGKTLYSADVARQFDVSVRTLNNAVVAIRGMSMHRYMQAAAALERAPATGAGRLDRVDEGDRARQRLLAHGRVSHAVPRPVRRDAAADLRRRTWRTGRS